MAKYIVDESRLISIADAIRDKTGKTEEMTLEQMATEISEIETGGSINMNWFNDGNTHIWITLTEGRTSPMLGVCPNGTVTVDWGDGTPLDTLTGTSLNTVQWTPIHEYGKPGDYVITLVVVDGYMNFFGDSYGSYLLRYSADNDNRNYTYLCTIDRIEMGERVERVNNRAFHNMRSLKAVILPSDIEYVNGNSFEACNSITSLNIPGSVNYIGGSAFRYAYGVCYYDFTKHTTIPTLVSTNAFDGIAADCEIRVPAALYDEWIAATNWTAVASYIKAV